MGLFSKLSHSTGRFFHKLESGGKKFFSKNTGEAIKHGFNGAIDRIEDVSRDAGRIAGKIEKGIINYALPIAGTVASFVPGAGPLVGKATEYLAKGAALASSGKAMANTANKSARLIKNL